MADPQQSGGTPTARPCEMMPLCATLGIEATARPDRDEVVVTMPWEPGGAVMSLAHAGRTVIVVETEVRDLGRQAGRHDSSPPGRAAGLVRT